MSKVYLLTGSNIGDSIKNLFKARFSIVDHIGEVETASSMYRTEPWGNKDQQDFLNQILLIDTELYPFEVMNEILKIEKEMGRNRQQKWEPRIIDIDILFYDDIAFEKDNLTIPHPLLQDRRFTLVPLNEIAPQFMHPKLNKTISELLEECNDMSIVEKL